ncbi:hypothetical protein CO2235_230131 [Cupriavidus oxalaticus]|uniref:Uncharacterized protein n=1 Tax=Cupriavidus oxalaticus TaxID=96344 RepID=A0A976BDC2_9BURK|nr:hypothetical protein CO2235_230131 [Cupriavidus oxalaticus]
MLQLADPQGEGPGSANAGAIRRPFGVRIPLACRQRIKSQDGHDCIAAAELRVVSFSDLEVTRRLAHGAEHTPRSVATSDSRGASSIAFC